MTAPPPRRRRWRRRTLIALLVAVLAVLVEMPLIGYGFAAAIVAGIVLFPILLPQIPTRDFCSKGFILGGLVALPFVLYARLVRHWQSLPPVHLGLSFRNWTFMRLLLSARACYHDAEDTYQEAGLDDRQMEVRHRLAQTNHLLDVGERRLSGVQTPRVGGLAFGCGHLLGQGLALPMVLVSRDLTSPLVGRLQAIRCPGRRRAFSGAMFRASTARISSSFDLK